MKTTFLKRAIAHTHNGRGHAAPTDEHALRVQEMDQRIEEALQREPPAHDDRELIRYAPPAARLSSFSHPVDHLDNLDAVGKAAAKAIVMQYDEAIRALEAMGRELVDCVKQAQTMAEGCISAVKYITETCDQYRDESKAILARIEHATALTVETRKTCDEMREKIQGSKQEREHLGEIES